MSATNAPFGMRPAYTPTGNSRPSQYPIASGYAANLFKGTPVLLVTAGTIQVATVTNDFLGIFDGVEYTDSTGKPCLSNYWPTGTVAADAMAWVYGADDPDLVYDIQADGAVAATAVGAQADFTTAAIGTGSTSTGLSAATLNATVEAGGAQGQLRIIGLSPFADNAWGDAYTMLRVQIAQHQYVANKVGI